MTEDKINEILTLAKENNKILRGMRSSQRWANAFNFVYYILIIGSFVGAYYYLQPLMDSVIKSYQGVFSETNNVAGSDALNQVKKALNIK